MYPIDFFWRAAERWPERIAIDAPDGTTRYDTLAARVAALAAALVAIDPAPQSRVGICAKNSAEHITVLLAVLASGKVWVPLNPKSTRPEIRRIVDATAPSILVLDGEPGKPGGVGELGSPSVAPAIANALFSLTGVRQRSTPLTLG